MIKKWMTHKRFMLNKDNILRKDFIKLLNYIFIFFIVTSLSGCMMMMKKDDNKGSSGMGFMKCGGMMNSSSEKNHDMNMEKDPESYKIAKRYCTQCHYLKEKNTHTSNEWQPTFNRMYTYMQEQNLLVPMEDEKDAIAKYYGVEK